MLANRQNVEKIICVKMWQIRCGGGFFLQKKVPNDRKIFLSSVQDHCVSNEQTASKYTYFTSKNCFVYTIRVIICY